MRPPLDKNVLLAFLTFLVPGGADAARQPGKDGPLTVAAAGTIVNRYATLAADASAGAASISVNNPGGGNGLDPTTLTANDLLLIVQMQGATIDSSDTIAYGAPTNLNNAGRWEFLTVSGPGTGVGPYSIPLAGYLKNGYTASGNVQILKAPQYSTLTINPGASIAAPNWNGTFGGVIALDVAGTATINGDVDAGARGFRGGTVSANGTTPHSGYRSAAVGDGARKGESIAGLWSALPGGAFGRGAPANGGGGGNAEDAGGGGGANAWNGIVWNGQGNPDPNPAYAAAWNLDPSLNAATTSSGGGRGGYSFSDTDRNALAEAPGNPIWGGDDRREVGGLGARPLSYDTASSRVYFGGGGGAGANSNGSGGAGGRGGGMVFLYADTVSGTGRIVATGGNGSNTTNPHEDAPGGAGGGGAVLVQARTSVTLGEVRADGGTGGSQGLPGGFPNEAQGAGGGGGGGYVYVCAPTVAIGTRTANGGANGTTASAALTEFLPNGATRGAPGKADAGSNCAGAGPPALTFTNVSAASGLDLGGFKEGGLAWGDFNNDSCPDAIVNTSDGVQTTRLFAQNRSGASCLGTFVDVTQCLASGLLLDVVERAVALGDYDNDGNLDFARSDSVKVEVYRSGGPGVTVDASCPSGSFAWSRFGVAGAATATFLLNSEGIGWIDFDKDGDLDLVSENSDGYVMLTNNPIGTLSIDTTTGLPSSGIGNGDYTAVADYDVDGDVDFLGRKENGQDLWYNDGTAPTFFARNLNFSELSSNVDKGSVAFCDFDNDSDFDIFWTNFPTNVNQIWRNNGGVDGAVTWTAMGTLPTGTSDVDGVSCGDIDHDGDVDIVLNAATGAVGDYVFRNDGGFSFVNVSPAGFGGGNSPAGAFADYDRDGDLDFLMNHTGANQLWRNETNDKNYLVVRALHNVGVAQRDAIGATVSLESCGGAPVSLVEEVSGGSGRGSQDTALVHFGLRRAGSPSGPDSPYVVRVKFVGGGIVKKAVLPSSLGCYQMVTILNTDADDLTACSVTAVTLEGFEAEGADSSVSLSWRTASELSNLGFHLYRSRSSRGPWDRITAALVPGLGSSASGASYRYRDSGLSNGTTYFYMLEDIETTGTTKRHGPVSATPRAEAREPAADLPRTLVTFGNPNATSMRVLSRNSRGVVVELTTGGFHAIPREDGTVEIDVPGFERGEGNPGLPLERQWIEAVAGRKVELRSVRSSGVEALDLKPAALSGQELAASWDGTQRLRRSRSSTSPMNPKGVDPREPARIVSVAFQGEVKKALLEMAPLRWNDASGKLEIARTLTVTIDFTGRETSERASPDGRTGRRQRTAHETRGVLARLATTERGLYALRYEELPATLRSGAASLRKLRLSRLGRDVPFHVEPVSGRFGPGSTLYFVSEGAEANLYGTEAVYELELRVSGPRIPTRSAAPKSGSERASYRATTVHEQQRYYQAGLLEARDLWFWDLILAPSVKSFPFSVSELAPSTVPDFLEVDLQGASDFAGSPDHHVRLQVNGTFVGEDAWNGKEWRRIRVELPAGVLREGENLLELENAGDTSVPYSMVFLDRFALSYQRFAVAEGGVVEGTWHDSGAAVVTSMGSSVHVLDVTETTPQWLQGGVLDGGRVRFAAAAGRSYLVVDEQGVKRPAVREPSSGRFKLPPGATEYVAIGPRKLLDAAGPLLDHRKSEGLAVAAVPVEELFDEMGFGEERPEAIRDFLAALYHHGGGRLRYALLVGDASYDFKNHLGVGVENDVPSLPIRTRYLWTASDQAFASVNGDDLLPDLSVGRLPASGVAELRAMIEKILAFEKGDRTGRGPIVLVTDNPDAAGDFDRDARDLMSSTLASYATRHLSLSALGVSEMRESVRKSFDGGASLVSYMGHGGIHLWASENIFDTSSVGLLASQEENPLVLTLDCLNGYFHFPYFDSLGEELLKAEGRGALAVIAPSGLSLNESAHALHRSLLKEITNGESSRLGDAFRKAQESFLATESFAELLSIYHLFGDPALSLEGLVRD
jgi:hypothetical protein